MSNLLIIIVKLLSVCFRSQRPARPHERGGADVESLGNQVKK